MTYRVDLILFNSVQLDNWIRLDSVRLWDWWCSACSSLTFNFGRRFEIATKASCAERGLAEMVLWIRFAWITDHELRTCREGARVFSTLWDLWVGMTWHSVKDFRKAKWCRRKLVVFHCHLAADTCKRYRDPGSFRLLGCFTVFHRWSCSSPPWRVATRAVKRTQRDGFLRRLCPLEKWRHQAEELRP